MNEFIKFISRRGYTNFFWDFDGTIKDSCGVKGKAYCEIFPGLLSDIAEKILTHHESNGGISRFEKIPLYSSWASGLVEIASNEELLSEFGRICVERVLDAAWIAGAEQSLAYIHNSCGLRSYLLTATPQDEINMIMRELGMAELFVDVCGSPESKSDHLTKIFSEQDVVGRCLFVGDSKSDFDAANAFSMDFLLVNDNVPSWLVVGQFEVGSVFLTRHFESEVRHYE